MSEEILIDGKKITELSDMFFEYCKLKGEIERLQEENEVLKNRNANLRLNLATYDLPEVKKVLTDWRTGELDKKFKKLQKENEGLKSLNDFNVQKIEVLQEENEKLKADLKGETEQCQKWYQLETDKHFQMVKYGQALEEIREIAKYSVMHNSELNANYQIILQKIDEVFSNE